MPIPTLQDAAVGQLGGGNPWLPTDAFKSRYGHRGELTQEQAAQQNAVEAPALPSSTPQAPPSPQAAPQPPVGGGIRALQGPAPSPARPLSADRQFLATGQELQGQAERNAGEQLRDVKSRQEELAKGVEYQKAMAGEATASLNAGLSEEKSLQRDADLRANQKHLELGRRAADIQAMHTDPQHWYKEKGTAGSIVAAISMAAGAFAANMPHSGGQNAAQQIIDNAISRDVAAQQADIDKAWKGLDFQADEDTKDYARTQHSIAQHHERMMLGYQHAMTQVDLAKQWTNDQDKIKALDGLKGGIQDAQLAKKQEYSKQVLDVGRHEEAQRAAAANAARQAALKNPDNPEVVHREWTEYANAHAKASLEHPDKTPPMLSYYEWLKRRVGSAGAVEGAEGPGAEGKKETPGQLYLNALDPLYKMQDMMAAGGEASPKRTAEGQSLVGQAANLMARAETGGTRAPSEAEMEILKKQLPSDPNQYNWTDAERVRLATTIAGIEEKAKRAGVAVPERPKVRE